MQPCPACGRLWDPWVRPLTGVINVQVVTKGIRIVVCPGGVGCGQQGKKFKGQGVTSESKGRLGAGSNRLPAGVPGTPPELQVSLRLDSKPAQQLACGQGGGGVHCDAAAVHGGVLFQRAVHQGDRAGGDGDGAAIACRQGREGRAAGLRRALKGWQGLATTGRSKRTLVQPCVCLDHRQGSSGEQQ